MKHSSRATAWAAVLLLAGPAVVVGCRLAGTDGITPVPQLLAFLPWLTVPAGLALLLALAGRRALLALLSLAVLAVGGWFVQPYGPSSTDAEGPVVAELRVLTSNVEFGRAAPELIEAIRRERPTTVFVSECDRPCAAALDAALRTAYPYRAQVAADGSAGSVILSVHPLAEEPAVPGVMGMPGATARVGGRDVRLQLAHPMPPLPGRTAPWKKELGRLRAFAEEHRGRPTLLAGDFNASADHAAFRRVLDAGRLHDSARLAGAPRTPTWPRGGPLPPFAQIDHVLVSDDFSVRGVRFLDVGPSDHRALLADLDLHAGG